jgi:hypothetical protein
MTGIKHGKRTLKKTLEDGKISLVHLLLEDGKTSLLA